MTNYTLQYLPSTIQAIAFPKDSPHKIIKKGQRFTLISVCLQIKFTSRRD